MYRVEVDNAPAYELCVSLMAYLTREDHKTLDLGAGWVKTVRRQITPTFAAEAARLKKPLCHMSFDLLIWQCPGERDADGFLSWLGAVSTGELYERLAPYTLPDNMAFLADLGGLREQYLGVLAAWNEQYFRHIDPAILAGLEADAEAKRALTRTQAPPDAVEIATAGIRPDPLPGLERVVLVPQYHDRPWNTSSAWRGVRFWLYPADVLPPAPGAPPLGLLRITRALDDESRLRILHLLADGPRGFTEIARQTGLAGSTVHHHMAVLRASGLVRLHVTTEGSRYSLRPHGLDNLMEHWHDYVEGGRSQ